MNKIDLIIDALEQLQRENLFDKSASFACYKALAAARELRDMKPMAWWEKDPDTGNWFLATWFNEHAETEPLYALGESNEP